MTATLIAESPDGDLRVTVSRANIKALRSYANLTRDMGDVTEAQAMVRYADTLTARLDVTDPVQPITPPTPTPCPKPAPPKHRTALRILGAVVACLAVLVGVTPHASARVYPTTNPIRVVVSGPRATVSAQLISTAARPDGTHAVMLLAPNGFMASGESRARGPVVPVTVSGTIPSYLLTPGSQLWVASDAGDESYVGVGVKVLRQSRFGRVTAVPVGGGRVFVHVPLSHYNIPTNTWMGSKLSPVQVQYAVGTAKAQTAGAATQWRTAATLTTDAAGNPAAGIVSLPKGPLSVRLVRAEGGNVTGTVSGAFPVVVR